MPRMLKSTNCMEHRFLESVIGAEPVNKFFTFYNSLYIIAFFTKLVTYSILRQVAPFQVLPSYLFNIHFNIIISSTLMSSQWPLSFRFPHQNPVCISILPHTWYRSCPSHSPSFDHPHDISLRSTRSKL